MQSATSADPSASGLNRWVVTFTLAVWAIVFVIVAARSVNAGVVSRGSVFVVLCGVGALLALASHAAKRPAVKWTLRGVALAALAGALYALVGGGA